MDTSGSKIGSETNPSNDTTSDKLTPKVISDPEGGFIITWI